MDSLQNNQQIVELIDQPNKAVHICQEFPSESEQFHLWYSNLVLKKARK